MDEEAEPTTWRRVAVVSGGRPSADCPLQQQEAPHISQPPRERTAPCLSFSGLIDGSCISACELTAQNPAGDYDGTMMNKARPVMTLLTVTTATEQQVGMTVSAAADRPTACSHVHSNPISGFNAKHDDSSAEPFDDTSVADKHVEADANPAIPRDMQQDIDFLNRSLCQLAGEQQETTMMNSSSSGVVVPVQVKPEDLLGQLLLSSLDSSPSAFGKDVKMSGVVKRRRCLSEISTINNDYVTGQQQQASKRGRRRKPAPNDDLADEPTAQPAAELTKREANRLAVHRHRQRRKDHLRQLSEENMTLKQNLAALVQHVKELTSGAPALTLAERKELLELRAMKRRVTEAVMNTSTAL